MPAAGMSEEARARLGGLLGVQYLVEERSDVTGNAMPSTFRLFSIA